ncbi:MAG: cupredoxin domain-containing protein [Candidatus Hydrothermarchaeaceae archaeon]
MVINVIFAGLILIAVILSSGCFQRSYSAPQQSTPPPITTEAPVATVDIKGFTFLPNTIKVVTGTIVTWTNLDSEAHTVISLGIFDSKALQKDESWSRKFDTIGTYEYECLFHPGMGGWVIVE